MGTESLKWLP